MNSIFSINRNRGEYLSKILARIGCLLLFAAMLFGVSTSQAQTVSADFSNRNGSTPAVPSGLFGANGSGVNVSGAAVSQLTNAGLTGTRIWVSVHDIYATATPNFSSLDGQLKNVSSAGLHPIAVMYQTPSSLGSNACSMPSNVSQWGQMAFSRRTYQSD